MVAVPVGLGGGAIVGIVLGSVLLVAVIVISAILGRRRSKPRPRHTASGPVRYGTDISTITEPNTLDRHMSALESMRSPMQSLAGGPPAYTTDDNHENMAFTADTYGRRNTLRNQHSRSSSIAGTEPNLPSEEPPPPYDSVVKDTPVRQSGRRQHDAGSSNGEASQSLPSSSSAASLGSHGSTRDSVRNSRRRSSHQLQQNNRPENPDRVAIATDAPPAPATDSEGQNIYEELSLPGTLRAGTLRATPDTQPAMQRSRTDPGSPQIPPGLLASMQGRSPYPSQYSPSGRPYSQYSQETSRPSPTQTTSLRTQPQHRIRLGTQALHARPGSATMAARPRNYLNDSDVSTSSSPFPADQQQAYEALDPPGPYIIKPNPYARIPVPLVDDIHLNNLDPSRMNHDPYRRQRLPQSRQFDPASYQHSRQPHNLDTGRPDRFPDPAIQNRFRPVGNNPHVSLLYAQRPEDSVTEPPREFQPPAQYFSPNRSITTPNTASSPGYHHQTNNPRMSDSPGPRSPSATSSSSRDWNTSFASGSSQDQLISSPQVAAPQSQFQPQHPRGGSNISSDIDSTSPLVPSQEREETQTPGELQGLTPTAV